MAQHLTLAERVFLHRLVKAKKPAAEIGVLMNRHRSTIYRELARNSNHWGYRPQAAHRWARKRREACRRRYKLKDVDLRLEVSARLAMAWSPDQIAGRLKREYPEQPARQVSAPTIKAMAAASSTWGNKGDGSHLVDMPSGAVQRMCTSRVAVSSFGRPCGFLAVTLMLSSSALLADTLGSGANSFNIDFVTIGNPGNSLDANPNRS
jgi:hypothetical protein